MQRNIKVDATIMDNFYKLVHSQPNIRLTAASSTYKILKVLKSRKPDAFNDNLNYCIERLVAGLASSRALARRGYGTLLLEILNSYHISTERLLTIAEKKFSHISKETSRDNLLAYFLLISIIMESGNYKRSKGNLQSLEKIYKILMHLQSTKSYLEYPVCKLLVEHYEQLYQFMLLDIPQNAFESDAKISVTELLIITLCHNKEPIRNVTNLDKSDLMKICSVLLGDKLQKRPLHPAYIEVSKFIMTHFPQHFEVYHSQILHATFFKANHNELASMGLELTSLLLESTDDKNIIKTLLNEHLLRLLILSLRNRTPLRTYCIKFFDSVQNHFKAGVSDEKQMAVIDRLTNSPGSIKFDDDSKSSSLRDLLQYCSKFVLQSYLDRLITRTKLSNQEEVLASSRQIAYIICRPQLVEDHETMLKVAKHLMSIIVTKDDLGESSKSALLNAYHATLHQMVSTSNPTQRIEMFDGLIDHYNQLDLKSKLWSSFSTSLLKYKKSIKKSQDTKILYPITTLYLFYGLQVIEHNLDCMAQLEELAQCSQDAMVSGSDDESWADILTDQIIAILSATECKPWIRKLCERVFGSLTPYISQTAIDLMCDVISAPLAGDDDDSCDSCDGEESEDDDDDSGSEDEEDNEDEELSISEVPMEVSLDKGAVEEDEDEEMSSLDSDENGVKVPKVAKADKNEESDEEEYLDDDQMIKLDSVIADMFKANRKKKRDPSFKLRCLDLISVLLKRHKDPVVINTILATIIPLYTSSRKSAETRPISDKIVTFLGKMPSKSKYPKLVDFLEKQKSSKKTTTFTSRKDRKKSKNKEKKKMETKVTDEQ